MPRLTLTKLVIEGFRSFKNRVEIELTTGPGLKYVSGDNRTNKRLGANGAGKSSMWEALIWCLYNTTAKGLRASDVTSWGQKKINVIVYFRVGESGVLKIERQSSPPRVLVDDVQAEQEAVNTALGLSRARFLHSVIFGQAVRLFPDLSLPERATILDEILDLSIWTRAGERSLALFNKTKAEMENAQNSIAQLEAKLSASGGASLAAVREASEDWESRSQEQLEAARASVAREKQRLRDLRVVEEARGDASTDLSDINNSIREAEREDERLRSTRTNIRSQITRADNDIAFYEFNTSCPVCAQPISDKFALDAVKNHKKERKAFLFDKEETEDAIRRNADLLEKRREARDLIVGRLASQNNLRKAAADAMREQERRLRAATESLEEMEQAAAAGNPHAGRLRTIQQERKEWKHKKEHLEEEAASLERRLANLDYWRAGGFKKVRLFVVKRVLAMLEIDVGNCISALGLGGWSVKFATETETKSGTTRNGIQILVASPGSTTGVVWEAWSGGESQRLRVAIAVGLSNLIQRLSGAEFAFEVWDEPSSWLSSEGVEDLLAALAHRAKTTKKSIWLLDHRALMFAGFAEIWQVKKNRQGAFVSRLQ